MAFAGGADGEGEVVRPQDTQVKELTRATPSLPVPDAGCWNCAAVAARNCCRKAALSFRRLSTVASSSEMLAISF